MENKEELSKAVNDLEMTKQELMKELLDRYQQRKVLDIFCLHFPDRLWLQWK